MAFKTILNLRDSVAGILSGVDITTVADLNGCFERAVSTMIQKASIPEASGMQNITLYSGVTDYLCNPKIFGTSITDIRPQGVSRDASNFVTKKAKDDFDREKGRYYPSGTTSTFEYNNGIPIIRILSPYPRQKTIIDLMNDTTGWTASGSASLLTQDTSTYYQSPASLRFTLTGASTGILTKTINSTDLSQYIGVGVGFLAIQIPDGTTASDLTNIEVRIGSDSSNYYASTSTTGFLGAWTAGNWLLVSFSGATATGSPDMTKATYVQFRFTTGAGIANFRVGGTWISMPSQSQILYKSAAIFLPVGGTSPLTTITLNTDEIILTDPAYNIYLQECALAALQNTGGSDNDSSSIKINRILDGNGSTDIGLYARFRGDNPSQELRTLGSWYDNN